MNQEEQLTFTLNTIKGITSQRLLGKLHPDDLPLYELAWVSSEVRPYNIQVTMPIRGEQFGFLMDVTENFPHYVEAPSHDHTVLAFQLMTDPLLIARYNSYLERMSFISEILHRAIAQAIWAQSNAFA